MQYLGHHSLITGECRNAAKSTHGGVQTNVIEMKDLKKKNGMGKKKNDLADRMEDSKERLSAVDKISGEKSKKLLDSIRDYKKLARGKLQYFASPRRGR